jgi:phosphatidylglycerophosphate synthase
MHFWIDATQPGSTTMQMFGLSLLERQLSIVRDVLNLSGITQTKVDKLSVRDAQMIADMRSISSVGGSHRVRVELPADTPIPHIAVALASSMQLDWSFGNEPMGARLQAFIDDSKGAAVVAMSADCEIDLRLLSRLASQKTNRVFLGGEGSSGCAAIGMRDQEHKISPNADSVVSIARALLECGDAKELNVRKFNGYIPKLRRTLPPYLIKITDTNVRDETERFLFESSYKGATDFLTKYVYPPLVWRMVKPLADRRVQPNMVTFVSIMATFGAVPFFATGSWGIGIALAFVMSVLDSVDGKLARVTFTSSNKGNFLDHGTDLIHPPLWYFAWAWGLSDGDPFSGVFEAAFWMMGLYVLDRVLERLFIVCTDRSVQDFRPLDTALRTFTSRRNVNLAIFVVALPFGLGAEGLYLIVAWQAATVAYHLVRVIQFWNGNPDEPQDFDSDESTYDSESDAVFL